MFGGVMALPDEVIIQCFIDCTETSLDEIKNIEKKLKNGENPRDIKLYLAEEIVKIYHGSINAKKAKEYFISAFSKKDTAPKDNRGLYFCKIWR